MAGWYWKDIQRAPGQRSFVSLDEVGRFVAEALEHGLPKPVARTPLDEVQEFTYQAWETDDPARRRQLARQALRRPATTPSGRPSLAYPHRGSGRRGSR